MTPRVGLGVDDGDAGAALGCIWPQAQAKTRASRRQAQSQYQSQSQASKASEGERCRRLLEEQGKREGWGGGGDEGLARRRISDRRMEKSEAIEETVREREA